jgi:hypothetical protein
MVDSEITERRMGKGGRESEKWREGCEGNAKGVGVRGRGGQVTA